MMGKKIVTDGRMQPQATDLEATALGAMLTDRTAVETAITLLEAEMFYMPENQAVFAAMADLHKNGKNIDLVTVAQHLRNAGKLNFVGGAQYLAKLSNTIGSGAHIEYHCKIVLQKYLMRKLIESGNGIVEIGFDESADVADALAEAQKQIADIAELAAGRVEIKSFSAIVDTSVEDAYRRADAVKSRRAVGIETGLLELDKKVLGWQNSNLIILAGRPGQGKSAVMLHFARTAARAGVPVVIFSLEMSAVSLTDRLVLSMCDVSAHRFRSGFISRDELYGIESAAEQLKQLPITIDDTPVLSISQIRAKARALHRRGRCGMVFIDYLQLIKMDLGYGRNVTNAVADISREAKVLAKEIDVPVMLLSQLNREVEHRADKRPLLADLRDSGAIEQDADIVMFVYRGEYYSADAEKNAGSLIIAKFREGAVGEVKVSYNDSLTKFYDYGISVAPAGVPVQGEIPF